MRSDTCRWRRELAERRAGQSEAVAESHAPEIFADEFVMLSRKIQKPPAGNPSPLAPGYPGRPCIDFCPMEYRDTRPLTTSRAPLHPRSPLFVTRPPSAPHSIPLSLPLSMSLYRDFQYRAPAREAKVDVHQARWIISFPTLHSRSLTLGSLNPGNTRSRNNKERKDDMRLRNVQTA